MNPDVYKAQCRRLAALYAEAAESGRSFQCIASKQYGAKWSDTEYGPTLGTDMDWRVKPAPQKFWIVWDIHKIPVIVTSEKLAEQTAGLNGGTIQEITAPE